MVVSLVVVVVLAVDRVVVMVVVESITALDDYSLFFSIERLMSSIIVQYWMFLNIQYWMILVINLWMILVQNEFHPKLILVINSWRIFDTAESREKIGKYASENGNERA